MMFAVGKAELRLGSKALFQVLDVPVRKVRYSCRWRETELLPQAATTRHP